MLCRPAARAALLLAPAVILACRDNPAAPSDDAARRYNPDWTRESHGRTAPQYGVVFPQEAVNTIEIAMTREQWASIRENMRALWGFDFGAAPGTGGPTSPATADPEYVDVTLTFNGRKWKNVGFRLKGNSTLGAAWSQGIYKVPFRLKLDEFEDRIAPIRDQRFYGFQELSMSPGGSDPSLIREKSAADILRLAGVPAARTAFYRVFIDFGEGLKYCGLYTAVEVIDDTMLASQFGESHGNLYKPESKLAAFAQSQFEKKNNRAAADWSDVRALIAALNSPLRTTDPAGWRAGLESTFDADHFLKWLAVNNTIVNWDTYGALAHNYFLYNHSRKRLTWIPWDHDLSLAGNPGVVGDPAGPPLEPPGDFPPPGDGPGPGPDPAPDPGSPAPGMSLTMNEVGADWPLIRYLADDPIYFARYRTHMRTFAATVFTEQRMDALFDRYHAMIAPYVIGPDGEQPGHTYLRSPADFVNSLAELRTHIRNRRAVVAEFDP